MQEIYIAGTPDEYPFFYYDKTEKTYEGIVPEILEQAAEESGLRLSYIYASSKDRREELAEDLQVELVCTYGMEEDTVEKAGLIQGPVLFSYEREGMSVPVSLAYTSIMDGEAAARLEEALPKTGEEQIQGMLVEYAQQEDNPAGNPVVYLLAGFCILLGCVTAYFGRRMEQAVAKKRKAEYEDPLTGRDNFTAWREKYSKIIQNENREHYAVAQIDCGIDQISHVYGFREANELLMLESDAIAPFLNRNTEAYARFGEFNFILFLAYASEKELEERVRDMKKETYRLVEEKKKKYSLSFHCGIYKLGVTDERPSDSLQYSHVAAEYAANHFRDVAFYSELVERETIEEFALGHEAVHGLLNDEFQIFLQPIMDLECGDCLGAEVLVRWMSPTRGMLRPDEFLPAMDKKHMTARLNCQVFEKGCRFLREELDLGTDLFFIFNFNAENLTEDLPAHLAAVTAVYGLDNQKIGVQFNETERLEREPQFMAVVKELRKYGFGVILGDVELDPIFYQFLQCGITMIKIKHTLTRHIKEPKVQTILQKFQELCRELNIGVLCVGIEDEEQERIARKLGFRQVSGYYYYPPLEKEVFRSLMEENEKSVDK
ncbi:MAG: EAL domain-containing protein [Blautia sp.]|jgi:EAL domain-containing protein (putative c-di-GMP-specific phosphodiesterase class I)/GGDEF domain-containing protein